MKKRTKYYAFAFIGLSISITIIFILRIYCSDFTFWSKSPVKFDITGQIGDFFGGVVGTIISAAGFYFLYHTFIDQRESYAKERLESRYFSLIELHRDNVSEFRFNGEELAEDNDSLFIENIFYEGKSVLKVIFNQFIICRNELRPFFKKTNPYLPEFEKKLEKERYIIENKIDIQILAKIDICYSIVFYGVSSEGLLILESLFRKKYKREFTNDILKFISLKPAYDENILSKWKVVSNRNNKAQRIKLVNDIYNWRKNKLFPIDPIYNNTIADYNNKYIKYYGGHQFRLSHYFRHLYQIVKFINSDPSLKYNEKYEYIKILRSQLSTYEQAIIFTNSLSEMGKSWEVSPQIDTSLKSYQNFDFELITKYNLIKNLPGESIYGIKFKEFFPNVDYENDQIKKIRNEYH